MVREHTYLAYKQYTREVSGEDETGSIGARSVFFVVVDKTVRPPGLPTVRAVSGMEFQ